MGFFDLNKFWIIGLLSGLLSAGIVLAALYFLKPFGFFDHSQSTPIRAMDILDTYRCPMSDKKLVFTHDKEDNYLYEGDESSSMHPRLLELGYYRALAEKSRVYDSKELDRALIDFFEVPSHISKGMFLVKLQTTEHGANDGITIGNLYQSAMLRKKLISYDYGQSISRFEQDPAWQIKNDIYMLDLEKADLTYHPTIVSKADFPNLLSYINAGKHSQILDFMISDDTPVDLAALVVCVSPKEKMGTSFTELVSEYLPNDLSYLSCSGDPLQKICNPYYGDTSCDAKLPLACFNDLGADLPSNTPKDIGLERFWSGGEIKLTPNVSGADFKTRQQANQYCKSSFGTDWRLADMGISGYQVIFSYANIPERTRVWIDVKDQKNANCWSREGAE